MLLHSAGPLEPQGKKEIGAFLQGRRRIAFVTAANLYDAAAYFTRVSAALEPPPPEGAELDLVHLRWDDRPLAVLAGVDGVFVGGGNAYALLWRLGLVGLLGPIRERVEGSGQIPWWASRREPCSSWRMMS